jgi:hypothetical protein
MGKSKGPRVPQRRNQPEPPKSEAETPKLVWKRHWLRVWSKIKRVKAIVASVLGLLSTATLLYSGTVPDIELIGPDASPFALPYIVKNTSSFFAMTDVSLSCRPGDGKLLQVGQLAFQDLTFATTARPITIPRHDQAYLFCSVMNGGAVPGSVVRGTIRPIIRFKTFGIARVHEGLDQTWMPGAHPPRWVQGRSAD